MKGYTMDASAKSNNPLSRCQPCGGLRRGATLVGLLLLVLTALPASVQAHNKGDEKLPPAPVVMRVIAPSAQGKWLLRLDNEGPSKVRIAADARLLRLMVWPLNDKGKRSRRPVVCDGPALFGLRKRFPQGRELVLESGHSYVQQFDPRLFCFGKKARAIRPGSELRATLGWKPKSKWSRRMAAAPFVADDANRPRKYSPLRRLSTPTFLLSHAAAVRFGRLPSKPTKTAQRRPAAPEPAEPAAAAPKPKAPPPPQPVSRSAEEASRYQPRRVPAPRKRRPKDELSAAFSLTASHYADARTRNDIAISVQAHNVGQRPVYVALRARQLSFVVHGPDGVYFCPRGSGGHHVPRELFRRLDHGKHIHMNVMLGEVCPRRVFRRAGLYRVIPSLHAEADGRVYGLRAPTGVITVRDHGQVSGRHDEKDDATLVRVLSGRERFYRGRPFAIPTRILPQ